MRNTQIRRCIIHQVRHSLTYIAWKDRKAFVAELKAVYQQTLQGFRSWVLVAGLGNAARPTPNTQHLR